LPGEALEESALSGAVRTDETAQLALAQREVHAVECDDAAETHREVLRLDDVAHVAPPPVTPSLRRATPAPARARLARDRAFHSRCRAGTTPLGTASTTTMRITPSTSELSMSVCSPSSSLTMPSAT